MVESHLQRCPACREELAGYEEVVRTIKAAPPPDPEPHFWENFNRELHLKLAQSAQSAPAPAVSSPFKKRYYWLGAPALAALLIWVAIGYLNPGQPVPTAPAPMAKQERAAEKMAATPQVPAPSPETKGTVALVAQNGEEMLPDDDWDDLRGDLDSTLSGMTEQEKETFLKRLRQHDKDGSCIRKYSAIFWA